MNLEELQAAIELVARDMEFMNKRLLQEGITPDPQSDLVLEAARRWLDPNLQQWIDEVVLALDAATKIGQRSCNSGDHLHYANHDRLIASAPNLAAAFPPRDEQ